MFKKLQSYEMARSPVAFLYELPPYVLYSLSYKISASFISLSTTNFPSRNIFISAEHSWSIPKRHFLLRVKE
jgi:hypothetical protein